MAEYQTGMNGSKSKREAMTERLRTKYPEKEYADDEALFGQINDDYDEYDKQLDRYKEREGTLVDLFNRDPRSAQFITDMARGNDPFIGMIQRIGVDGMTDLINDPAKQAEFAEANKEYVARVAREKELEAEYEKNLAESLTLLEKIKEERGLSDEQIDPAYELIGKIADEAIHGIFTEESIDMALKALNYESAVEAAGVEGEVKGRNSRIEEKLRKPQMGDGQPMLGGANDTRGQSRRKMSIFDEAREAQ